MGLLLLLGKLSFGLWMVSGDFSAAASKPLHHPSLNVTDMDVDGLIDNEVYKYYGVYKCKHSWNLNLTDRKD